MRGATTILAVLVTLMDFRLGTELSSLGRRSTSPHPEKDSETAFSGGVLASGDVGDEVPTWIF